MKLISKFATQSGILPVWKTGTKHLPAPSFQQPKQRPSSSLTETKTEATQHSTTAPTDPAPQHTKHTKNLPSEKGLNSK